MSPLKEFLYIFIPPHIIKNNDAPLVPAHLVPNGHLKNVRSVRQVKSGMTGETTEYIGDNGFSYGDDGAITRNFEAIMQISMHK